jgi:multiple antibiotic resistance protein
MIASFFSAFTLAFTSSFMVLLASLNPIGTASLFAIMTKGTHKEYQVSMANKALIIVLILFTAFGLGGHGLLSALGVSMASFKVAGGILLFLTGLNLVMDKMGDQMADPEDVKHGHQEKDISVFPIAIPMLAGPATITALVLAMEQAKDDYMMSACVMLVLYILLGLVYFMLRGANWVQHVLGHNVIAILSRIFGLILCCMATEFILTGLDESKVFIGGVNLI